MSPEPLRMNFSVPGEHAIAAEMAASGLQRMQAIQRIRQRDALRRAGFDRKGGLA